jgi:hypothetical protein
MKRIRETLEMRKPGVGEITGDEKTREKVRRRDTARLY